MATNKANKVMNGTYGKIWVNGELWAEISAFESSINFEYEDVNFCDDLGTHKKMMGWEGEGSLTIKKVNSRSARLIGEQAKTGIVPEVTIIGKLSDPDAHGAERISISNVTFNEFSLMTFEMKNLAEEEMSFNFGDYDFIDLVQ